MTWTADDLGDHSGRTVVVTGANSGTGREVARAFAGHGARVVLAVRNVEAGAATVAEIAAEHPGAAGRLHVERLDLASLASIHDLADRLDRPIDVLVNNAGVMAPPKHRMTEDGFELQLGTNHLGHFALTGLLLPRLLETPAPRVATMSSISHHAGGPRILDGNPASSYSAQAAYGNSKLGNLLFALELQRRATAAGSVLTSTAAHPGVTYTNLFSSPDGMGGYGLVRRVVPMVMKVVLPPASAGATALLYAASAAAPGSYTGPQRLGESRGPIGPAKLSPWARDEALAQKVWAWSEEQTGVSFAL